MQRADARGRCKGQMRRADAKGRCEGQVRRADDQRWPWLHCLNTHESLKQTNVCSIVSAQWKAAPLTPDKSMSHIRRRMHKADLAALIVGAGPFMSGSVLPGSVMGAGGPGRGVQPLSPHPVCFSN